MAKTILEEALADAKILKQSAIENAKNVLVEAISPQIKQFVESQLGETETPVAEGEVTEDAEAVSEDAVPEATMPMYQAPHEGHEQAAGIEKLLQLLGLSGKDLGLNMGHEQPEHGGHEDHSELDIKVDAADPMEKSDEDESEEDHSEHEDSESEDEESDEHSDDEDGEEDKDMDKDEKEVDEVVEITNEDLKAALSEVLSSVNIQKEAKVSKGFKDVEDTNKGAMGLADKKAGEHQWKDVEPSDKKDWTIKEAKQCIAALVKENAALKQEGSEYKKAYTVLKQKLQEVNLFNNKLLYTQKVLNTTELNNKQRLGVIEAFDRAQNMREVELVYKSLSESFKIAGAIVESKQDRATRAKASRLSTPSSTILKEAMVKEEKERVGDSDMASRMKVLAGILEQ